MAQLFNKLQEKCVIKSNDFKIVYLTCRMIYSKLTGNVRKCNLGLQLGIKREVVIYKKQVFLGGH